MDHPIIARIRASRFRTEKEGLAPADKAQFGYLACEFHQHREQMLGFPTRPAYYTDQMSVWARTDHSNAEPLEAFIISRTSEEDLF
jgi:hypothetical protein